VRYVYLFSGCDAERRGWGLEVMSLGSGEPWGVQAREHGGGIRSVG